MAVFRGPGDEDVDGTAEGLAHSASSEPGHAKIGWLLVQFLRRNRGRLLGLTIGLSIGFGVKYLGFLWTLFISVCAVVGYFVGKRLDENHEDLLELLDRVLPPGRS